MNTGFYIDFLMIISKKCTFLIFEKAIGAISLILVGVAYVPIWTLDVFLGTVTTCLALSLLYMVFYLVAGSSAIQRKANRVTVSEHMFFKGSLKVTLQFSVCSPTAIFIRTINHDMTVYLE